MDLGSFWSVWYWIAHAVIWSLASHFALGVPHDMVQQANREEDETGPWSRAAEAVMQAQIFRFTAIFDRYGEVMTGVGAFLLSVVATMGFYVGVELSKAIFCILAPLTLIYAFSIRTALRVRARRLSGADLRGAISRQRLVNQAIGFAAIILTVVLAVTQQLSRITPI